jgi:hypothetical protein
MVKYGKGVFMTRKMTITLEEELLTSLDNEALKSGKKKTQIIKAIDSYNKMVEEDGLILKSSRMF